MTSQINANTRLDTWQAQGFDPHNCPVREILSGVTSKWTVLVLIEMDSGPKRFNQLLRRLPDVSRRMLTQSLRDLERNGLATRTVLNTRPPGTEYSLSGLGRSLLPPLLNLVDWASQHQAFIVTARQRFDDQEPSA